MFNMHYLHRRFERKSKSLYKLKKIICFDYSHLPAVLYTEMTF